MTTEDLIAASLGRTIETLNETMPSFNEDEKEALYTLAYDFYENGQYREAVNFFRFLTTVDYMNKKHWIGLGASLQMLKEYDKAINGYTVAAMLDQQNPHIPYYVAECCFSQGDHERGMLALESAEELAAGEEKLKGLKSQIAALRQAWSPRKAGE